ncbi:MAG: tRNA lysidine(34) synthetase TilS [Firmicutes bacterium]|nr:tRNA lysidine(34) synthetase TilS [Bacillota bacterium]
MKKTKFAIDVLAFIKKHSLIEMGDNLAVSVSGGADSICLLHFLVKHKHVLKYDSLTCIHINHNLRGADSLRDEAFVTRFAKSLGLETIVFSEDVGAYCKAHNVSIELGAREVRQAVYKKLVESNGFSKVALGHTKSDNAETILFNIIRGAGLRGVMGIQPRREHLVRPLLDKERRDIENYVKVNNLGYVHDISNDNTHHTRNFLRHEIIPLLNTRYNVTKTLTMFANNIKYEIENMKETNEKL